MSAYYNENDPFAAAWLRALIADNQIAQGDVDERSIADVAPSDLHGYTQCHFFAGIGGWSYALRLAGWPDDRACWTGSCPCQPFSAAGAGLGFDDPRHLWPQWFRLLRVHRPVVCFGEQVDKALAWLDLVSGDLEGEGYAVGSVIVGAHSVGAPHRRQRIYWVANAERSGRAERGAGAGNGQIAGRCGANGLADSDDARSQGRLGMPERADKCTLGARGLVSRVADADIGAGDHLEWVIGADGKARRVKPGVRLLAHGIPNRVAKLRAFGNAIVPQCAAVFVASCMEVAA